VADEVITVPVKAIMHQITDDATRQKLEERWERDGTKERRNFTLWERADAERAERLFEASGGTPPDWDAVAEYVNSCPGRDGASLRTSAQVRDHYYYKQRRGKSKGTKRPQAGGNGGASSAESPPAGQQQKKQKQKKQQKQQKQQKKQQQQGVGAATPSPKKAKKNKSAV
jgi:hypothetical protein